MNNQISGVRRPLTPVQQPEGRTRETVLLRAPLVSGKSLSLLYPVTPTIRQRLRTR